MDKIICVGKNYLKHAKELGGPIPTEPLYFLKPPSTINTSSSRLRLSSNGEVHHEVELVLKIAQRGTEFFYSHFTFGLDLTLRELQSSLKKAGQPWEKAKVFKNSTVLGTWHEIDRLESVLDLNFTLTVNGQLRQSGLGKDMRWGPVELLSDIQKWFPPCPGDLLFTGTPEGVGPLRIDDQLEVRGGPVQYQLTCE